MGLRTIRAQFAREYSTLFDAVYRYACYRVPNRDDAEEIVQEALTKAYTNIAAFRGEKGTLRQWVFGIARNELLMHWRKQKPMVSLDLERLEDTDIQPSTDFPRDLDQQMMAERILAALPTDQKALLALRHLEGLSYEELAEMTGKEPAALRQFFSRLHRALKLEFHDLVSFTL